MFTSLAYVCSGAWAEGGGRGSGPIRKKFKNIGFHSNTGPDPLKNHKATKLGFKNGP